jgi:hypothetical protein
MFDNPFAYFVFLSWSGFILAMVVYVVTYYTCHFKHYCEKL